MADPFAKKRVMRANRIEATNRGIAALLDLGTSKIACIVLSFKEETAGADPVEDINTVMPRRYRVIGYATSQSYGMEAGAVKNRDRLIEALQLVLSKAQQTARQRVDHLFVSMSGGDPEPYASTGEIRLGNNPVSDQDIARTLRNCSVPDTGIDREYLHAHPINFSVDHRSGIHDPRGESGNRISVDLHMVTVKSQTVADVIACIEQCGLTVAGVASSAYASGLSTLVSEELENGSACVDIGAATSGIAVFYKKHMVHTCSLRVGGNHITADIADVFSIPVAAAERLKTLHGSVMATREDDRSFCESFDTDRSIVKISRSELIGVIKPRVEEILEDIRSELDRAGFSSVPGQSIVLTGGCVHLLNLEDMAKCLLGPQTRSGRPMRLFGLPQVMTGPPFSSVVGLCLHAVQPQDEFWDFPMVAQSAGSNALERTVRWILRNI